MHSQTLSQFSEQHRAHHLQILALMQNVLGGIDKWGMKVGECYSHTLNPLRVKLSRQCAGAECKGRAQRIFMRWSN